MKKVLKYKRSSVAIFSFTDDHGLQPPKTAFFQPPKIPEIKENPLYASNV